jgi:hypothetical protein
MDRVDEIIYPAGLPGVPRVILWVKFSAEQRGWLVLIGMDFMWDLIPHKPIFSWFKTAPRGGVLNPLANKK